MRTISRSLRYFLARLLRIRDTPESVASGFSIGIAVGCIPFFGIQTVIALFLALVFRVNKVAQAYSLNLGVSYTHLIDGFMLSAVLITAYSLWDYIWGNRQILSRIL